MPFPPIPVNPDLDFGVLADVKSDRHCLFIYSAGFKYSAKLFTGPKETDRDLFTARDRVSLKATDFRLVYFIVSLYFFC